MVRPFEIGVIGIQGAISEHVNSMKKALKKNKKPGNVFILKNINEINFIDGLIIPGGESTTISKFMYKNGFFKDIEKRIKKNNLPIMGTCAGCVLLSKQVYNDDKNLKILNAIDMQIIRNAFGRQKESFEYKIKIKEFEKKFNAVFIRAPIIDKVWGECVIMSKIDSKIIMVKQDKFIATSFHPELTDDLRIHEYFLKIIENNNE